MEIVKNLKIILTDIMEKKGDLTKEKVIFEQGHLGPLRKNMLMHYFASAAAPNIQRSTYISLHEHSHRPIRCVYWEQWS